jgi:hypothetical protein
MVNLLILNRRIGSSGPNTYPAMPQTPAMQNGYCRTSQ